MVILLEKEVGRKMHPVLNVHGKKARRKEGEVDVNRLISCKEMRSRLESDRKVVRQEVELHDRDHVHHTHR